MNREQLKKKIRGSLIAGALGDALGYAVEFSSYDRIRAVYGPEGITELKLQGGFARFSDDTQMTLFTCEGMIKAYEEYQKTGKKPDVNEYIYRAYLCWLRTQGMTGFSDLRPESDLANVRELNALRAPGNTCISALASGEMGTLDYALNHSKGCGGVMRTAPCGFVKRQDDFFEAALLAGAKAGAITHSHPLGWIPAGCLADIVYRCLYGEYHSLQELVLDSIDHTALMFEDFEYIDDFADIMYKAVRLAESPLAAEDGEVDNEQNIAWIGQGWVGEEALAIAVYCALRFPFSPRKALHAAVNHSGDSDSTGAICGNIIGAWLGIDAVDAEWIAKLECSDLIMEYGDRMAQMSE